jgi:hypothetical protein
MQERRRLRIVAAVFARPKTWMALSTGVQDGGQIPDKRSAA